MTMLKLSCVSLLALYIFSGEVYAAEGHHLFNPTPDDQLRPMTTERPSKTDSAYSLDAGRVQVETNLFGYVRNDDCTDGTCTDTRQRYFGGSTNLRIGLLDNTDIQFITDLYREINLHDETADTTSKRSGIGDTQVRLKVNLIGNDPSTDFSLAVLPYVKIPTNQDDMGNDRYEGGIGLPFNLNFDGGWSLGGMTQYNLISQPDETGYDSAYANSLIVGKSFAEKWSGYTEVYTYKADQSGARWQNTAGVGAIYSVTDNFKVDANLHLGLSDAADDTNFFVGTAYRF